jgi:O-acetylserine/cysteine efflux transporter
LSASAPASAQSLGFSSRDLVLAGLIVLIWGMNFVVMKFGLREFTPFQLAAARFALASLPLMLFIKKPALPWRIVVIYGLIQGVGQFGFLFTALKVGMTASLASVLMQTQVFFTAVIAWWFLGERVTKAQLVGMGLAACGLFCFAMHFAALDVINTVGYGQNHLKNGLAAPSGASAAGLVAVGGVTLLGLLLNLCAAASWASANVVARSANKANPQYDALSFVVWTSAVPVPALLAMSFLFDPPAAHANWLNAGPTAWGAAIYLAAFATVWAYAMWTQLLKRHAASKVAPFGLAVPAVGLTAGMLILGENIAPWQWAGVGFVVAALVATAWSSLKPRLP